jgi:uncharacterized membrane protein YbhN (UPF0104 family)
VTDSRQPAGVRALARPAPTVTVALAVALLAMLAWTLSGGDEWADDLAVGVQITWPAAIAATAIVGLAAVHFLSAAFAVRSVSGRRLALRSTTYAQLAAAATNRIIPNGIGGTGVNLRYLLRAGLHAGAATSALATLAVAGAITDAAYASAVTSAGPSLGVTGAATELRNLTARGMGASAGTAWLLFAALLAVCAVTVIRHRKATVSAVTTGIREAVTHVRTLARHPGRISGALLASMLTTAAMSTAFVVAVHAWGNAPTPLPAGALIALYLLAATLGGATPLPAFVGLTETALVGGLILSGYSSGSAILAVVIFRLITYWLPLPLGVLAARNLRTQALL